MEQLGVHSNCKKLLNKNVGMQSQGMYQQVAIDGLEQLTKALAMAGPDGKD